MTIDQQLQQLIQQAPTDEAKADLQVIAPVLKALAKRLQHLDYYLLQDLEQRWVMTQLQHRGQPDLTKTVIYAYPSLEAVSMAQPNPDPQLMALPIPTVQLLFQLLAIKPIDSLIFLDQSQPPGIEISRQLLQSLIAQQLQPPIEMA
ncbi:MAG: hypothetical protein KME07_20615 [Pegethrix bostrychoides GSE-TBD4-15B]|jgi:hypothetical protein|uniref:Uncharacterized protein n=1 Tax=Pegethrix bostrychoides GSE-TBD4-15B TaxID=2839662 RepID=A0A951U7U3_9CYAN|nr:hypothetical protein [Pegethrix bostrychoides GSE-TBD4-15B]